MLTFDRAAAHGARNTAVLGPAEPPQNDGVRGRQVPALSMNGGLVPFSPCLGAQAELWHELNGRKGWVWGSRAHDGEPWDGFGEGTVSQVVPRNGLSS